LGWILLREYLFLENNIPDLGFLGLSRTTLKNHVNQPKTMKNNETTLKSHGNQPKTLKNHVNQPKTMTYRVP
jgi:hypothetical protein